MLLNQKKKKKIKKKQKKKKKKKKKIKKSKKKKIINQIMAELIFFRRFYTVFSLLSSITTIIADCILSTDLHLLEYIKKKLLSNQKLSKSKKNLSVNRFSKS